MKRLILISITLLLAITSMSATEFMFNHIWSNPSIKIIEHTKYNVDTVYYTNSRNKSVWMSLDEFNSYNWTKSKPKIDRIEFKGELLKFKTIKEPYSFPFIRDNNETKLVSENYEYNNGEGFNPFG